MAYNYQDYFKTKSPTGYDIYKKGAAKPMSYQEALPMFQSGFNAEFVPLGSLPPVAPNQTLFNQPNLVNATPNLINPQSAPKPGDPNFIGPVQPPPQPGSPNFVGPVQPQKQAPNFTPMPTPAPNFQPMPTGNFMPAPTYVPPGGTPPPLPSMAPVNQPSGGTSPYAPPTPPTPPQDPNALSKSGQYYKSGNDVLEAGTNRHIDPAEFQKLGLNYALLPEKSQTDTGTTPPTPPGTNQDAQGGASSPAMPQISPEATKAMQDAEKAYQASMQLSPDELSTQEEIDRLIESAKSGYRSASGQAIPMEFITGQLKAIEQRASGLAEPLERKLARIQASRQASTSASKFALERSDKAIEREQGRAEKEMEYGFKEKEFGEEQRQFGVTSGMSQQQINEQKRKNDLDYRLSEAKYKQDATQFGQTYAQKNREIAIKEKEGSGANAISPYQAERASRTLQSVSELKDRVSGWTVGTGSLLGWLPETDARNFKAEVDTLKSNIAFSELTAMREASKTGGALGQVSDKEAQLLQSALGALDLGQSPANFRAQLDKVESSIKRWQDAMSQNSPAGTIFNSPSGASYQLPY